jgi:hypothetical protein
MISISVIGKSLRPQLKRLEEKQARLLANDIFRGVKDHTPVDTGRAKRGWRLLRRRFGFIINNYVPYIRFLEQGSSKQAPRGMVKPTLERLRARNKIR